MGSADTMIDLHGGADVSVPPSNTKIGAANLLAKLMHTNSPPKASPMNGNPSLSHRHGTFRAAVGATDTPPLWCPWCANRAWFAPYASPPTLNLLRATQTCDPAPEEGGDVLEEKNTCGFSWRGSRGLIGQTPILPTESPILALLSIVLSCTCMIRFMIRV